MTWTVIKADFFYMLLMLPVLVGINLLKVFIERRRTQKNRLMTRAWARGEQSAQQQWKTWVMRRRRRPKGTSRLRARW